MQWNWLQGILYGLISGFTAFLPVPSTAHQILFETMSGAAGQAALFRLACRIGVLAALILSCRLTIRNLLRQRRLSRIPVRKRKRQPDPVSIMELRFLRTAWIPATAGMLLCGLGDRTGASLPLLALTVLLGGVLVYLPGLFRSGNKDAPTSSVLDAVATGCGMCLSVLPGISGVAGVVSVGALCGLDRRFALRVALLLSIPATVVRLVFDGIALAAIGVGGFSIVLLALLSAAAAFLGALASVGTIRFLTVKSGASGFAYYCWGLALFIFALFLII